MYEDGYDQMLIIGVGQSNLQNNFGANFTANSDLPLVLDPISESFPIRDLLDGIVRRKSVMVGNVTGIGIMVSLREFGVELVWCLVSSGEWVHPRSPLCSAPRVFFTFTAKTT